ncbi:MAG: pteridine reductase [Gammaproteobacteria bacterium]
MEHPVVLITGAAARIGAATARQLHAAGWNVVIHYRNSADAAAQLAAELDQQRPHSSHAVQADLARHGALAALAQSAASRWGRLDALVNNASSYFQTPLAALSEAQFDDLIGSNLKAPLFLAQACAAQESLRAIVNILDIHVRRPMRGYAPYLAAKAGLWTVTEALALELAPRVRVNAVAPGHMIWATHNQMSEAQKAAETARIPLGRLGGAEEVARAVAFLLSPDAAYLNGAVIPVDGGLRLG